MEINNNIVKKFEEKPQLQKGWINGGYFIVEPDFLKFIGNKNVILKIQCKLSKRELLLKNMAILYDILEIKKF